MELKNGQDQEKSDGQRDSPWDASRWDEEPHPRAAHQSNAGQVLPEYVGSWSSLQYEIKSGGGIGDACSLKSMI